MLGSISSRGRRRRDVPVLPALSVDAATVGDVHYRFAAASCMESGTNAGGAGIWKASHPTKLSAI
jgi:hypothetical protein